MRSLVISERAEADLREVWRWSYGRFGEAQASRYGWSRLIRKHVAFYTFNDAEVVVQRVLHGSMDPARHVER